MTTALATAGKFGVDTARLPQSAQGFLTSRGRFVGRADAAAIQKMAGIPSVDPNRVPYPAALFSEDLY